ncbi:16S rRNA (uracil(1498)-N(3))-methyltransferase [Pectinatus brassicae]|uniref:Ribosomal RNA small subunit methyltransferase E n=1 Tax=Pectinatus brassicae TaxID=862415 RepID=A0A840UEN8_9FIRM|nr:16S rRNA (uracil(1498)-N(3))-methyltransferase [Pectinatus brassicae]MBB5335576.1 16S rRNA (uracil1498-N3)-methyltransferase [Pectinatus brassicae]
MRRLFIEDKLSEIINITGEDAVHLLYAMRAKPGQKIIVADKDGQVAQTVISECADKKVTLKLIKILDEKQNESFVEIILMQCLPKGDKMDYIVQKAVELGINKIVPVSSHNCVVKYDAGKKEKRRQKWQKIAQEAAKQCGRTFIPEVEEIISIDQCINSFKDVDNVIICYENELQQSFKNYLQAATGNKYAVLIGPEGGFTTAEVEKCINGGAVCASLGRRILRTETASLAAISLIQYEKGDLGI